MEATPFVAASSDQGTLHTLAELAYLSNICRDVQRRAYRDYSSSSSSSKDALMATFDTGSAAAGTEGRFTLLEAMTVLQHDNELLTVATLEALEDARLLQRVVASSPTASPASFTDISATVSLNAVRWYVPDTVASSMNAVMEMHVLPEQDETVARWMRLYVDQFKALAEQWNACKDILDVRLHVELIQPQLEYIFSDVELSGELLLPLFDSVWDAASLMRARLQNVWDALFSRLLAAANLALAKRGKAKETSVDLSEAAGATGDAPPTSPPGFMSTNLLHELKGLCCIRLDNADMALDELMKVRPPSVRSQRLQVQALILKGSNIDSHYPMNDEGNIVRERYGLPAYQNALRIAHAVGPPAYPEASTALLHLSRLYKNIEDKEQALELAKKGVSIRERISTQSHPDFAASLVDLAFAHLGADEQPEAMECYVRALAIFERVLGPRHVDTANTASDMAILFAHIHEYDNALDAFNYALAIYSHLGYFHEVQTTNANCAHVMELMHKDLDAIPYYDAALDACIKQHGDMDHRVGMLHYNIGLCYARVASWPKAIHELSQAYDIVSDSIGQENETFQRIHEALEQVHKDAQTVVASGSSPSTPSSSCSIM